MKQMIAPNGKRIVGTKESVPCVALVNGWSDTMEPIFAGQTDLDWDGQHHITDENDQMVVVDEDGEEYPVTACKLVDA